MNQVHLKIHGRVQGVCFRSYTQKKAQELGLTGWIKNRDDETVEILAEGDKKNLELFLFWCQEGSPGSRVDKIEKNWQEINKSQNNNFYIKY